MRSIQRRRRTLDQQVAQKGITQAGHGVSRCEWGERDPAGDRLPCRPAGLRRKVTAGLGIEMLDTMEAAIAQAGEIKLPTYIAHGDADVMAARRPRGLFDALGADDQNPRLLAGLYHEIVNEPGPGGARYGLQAGTHL